MGIKIDEEWGFYVAEEFCGYLNSIKKDECFKPEIDSDFPDYRPTYICGPKPLNQEEEKKWPGCEVICFRAVGYTIGHLIVEETDPHHYTIREVVVYDRESANIFKVSCKELEKDLKERFEGKILA